MIVVIADTAKVQLQYLKEGLAHANVGQNGFEMGKQALDTLYKIVNQQEYDKTITTPLTYCNQENVDSCTIPY